MATIHKLPNNKFRAEVRKNQSTIKTKTFSVLQQAEDWGVINTTCFARKSIQLATKPIQKTS